MGSNLLNFKKFKRHIKIPLENHKFFPKYVGKLFGVIFFSCQHETAGLRKIIF